MGCLASADRMRPTPQYDVGRTGRGKSDRRWLVQVGMTLAVRLAKCGAGCDARRWKAGGSGEAGLLDMIKRSSNSWNSSIYKSGITGSRTYATRQAF